MKPKNIYIFVLTIFLAFLIYQFFLKQYASQTYCKNQADFKSYKFNQSIKKNGAPEKIEQNEEVKKFLASLYNKCLR